MEVNTMNKKGITPIISTVLLLMLVVAILGLTYVFISGTTQETQEEVSAQLKDTTTNAKAEISIDTVWNDSGNISFVLRNTGSYSFSAEEVNQIQAYFDGTPMTIDTISEAFAEGNTKTFNSTTAYAVDKIVKIIAPKGFYTTKKTS